MPTHLCLAYLVAFVSRYVIVTFVVCTHVPLRFPCDITFNSPSYFILATLKT